MDCLTDADGGPSWEWYREARQTRLDDPAPAKTITGIPMAAVAAGTEHHHVTDHQLPAPAGLVDVPAGVPCVPPVPVLR
jgi:hypothetical protein